jgi:hypothetical protein
MRATDRCHSPSAEMSAPPFLTWFHGELDKELLANGGSVLSLYDGQADRFPLLVNRGVAILKIVTEVCAQQIKARDSGVPDNEVPKWILDSLYSECARMDLSCGDIEKQNKRMMVMFCTTKELGEQLIRYREQFGAAS